MTAMEVKIYIDRLKEGQIETFEGSIAGDLCCTREEDLIFDAPIACNGSAYIAGDHIVIKFQAKTHVKIPCSICNTWTEVPLELTQRTHTELLSDVSSGVVDFSSILRNDLLLELPQFAECLGSCPERENIKKFIRSSPAPTDSAHFPFSGL